MIFCEVQTRLCKFAPAKLILRHWGRIRHLRDVMVEQRVSRALHTSLMYRAPRVVENHGKPWKMKK